MPVFLVLPLLPLSVIISVSIGSNLFEFIHPFFYAMWICDLIEAVTVKSTNECLIMDTNHVWIYISVRIIH